MIANQRRLDMVSIIHSCHDLHVYSMGFPFLSLNDTYLEFNDAVNSFRTNNDRLYLEPKYKALIDQDASHSRLYRTPSILLTDLNSKSVPFGRLSPLWDATQTLLGKVKVLLDTPATSLSPTFEPLYWVLNNTAGPILNGMNQALSYTVSSALDQASAMQSWALALTLVATSLLVLVVIVVVRPTVWDVESNKVAVLNLFVDIPTAYIQVLHKKAVRRVQILEALHHGDNIDDLEPDFDVNNLEVEDINFDQAQNMDKNRKRHISADSHAFQRYKTLLKVAFCVVLTALYFGVAYYVDFGRFQADLSRVPRTLEVGGWHRSLIRFTHISIDWRFCSSVEVAKQGVVPLILGPSFEDSLGRVDELERLHHQLAFGTDNIAPPASGLHEEIFFRDLCLMPTLSATDQVDCRSGFRGLPSLGIHASTLSMMDWLRTSALDARSFLQTLQANASITAPMAHQMLYALLLTDEFDYVDNMDGLYYGKSLEYTTNMHASKFFSDLDSVFGLRVGLLIGFVALTVLLYAVFYSPLIWSLNTQNRRTSSMLLMIPADVMERIGSIRQFVDKLAAYQVD
eukprot:TRINITY_DN3275_c0_g1_i4.p1 TRINITY_DN3275_c0_g1~~TRINITY_DN3275_c0_g1_i4.p1  ORF type:complete len:570 (+),score=115.97 TRINITY_DN3275_c0_g1_i4:39-1748(+)